MLTYAAFDRLSTIWQTRNSPQLHSFEPFNFNHWLGSLRVSAQDLQQELRENLLNLDEEGKLSYLQEMRAQLDAALDTVANLPTAKPTRTTLRQILRRGKPFPHSEAYMAVVDSLPALQQEESSPQRDETAAAPFQNEAIQAAFVETYRFITQRLAAVQQASASTTPVAKPQSKQKSKPLIIWNAGPKDLADLILTLAAKNHLTISGDNKNALSRAITSLFQLPHETPVTSPDWKILANYLGTEIIGNPRVNTETETYRKRTKNSLYEGIKGLNEQ